MEEAVAKLSDLKAGQVYALDSKELVGELYIIQEGVMPLALLRDMTSGDNVGDCTLQLLGYHAPSIAFCEGVPQFFATDRAPARGWQLCIAYSSRPEHALFEVSPSGLTDAVIRPCKPMRD